MFGSFFDISAYAFFSVQRDLEFRKQWDKLVLKLDIIEVEPDYMIPPSNCSIDDSGNELVHWVMKYPVLQFEAYCDPCRLTFVSFNSIQ